MYIYMAAVGPISTAPHAPQHAHPCAHHNRRLRAPLAPASTLALSYCPCAHIPCGCAAHILCGSAATRASLPVRSHPMPLSGPCHPSRRARRKCKWWRWRRRRKWRRRRRRWWWRRRRRRWWWRRRRRRWWWRWSRRIMRCSTCWALWRRWRGRLRMRRRGKPFCGHRIGPWRRAWRSWRGRRRWVEREAPAVT